MDKLIYKNNKVDGGFSTIELMIALAIMSLILTAVILVSFGNQSFLIGSQTNAEAMKKAQELLETEQAFGRKDFNLVNSIPEADDDIYKKSVNVKLLPDFLTKEVRALVKWKNERGLDKTLELTTLIANFDNPVGGNTCNSDLVDDSTGEIEDWTDPEVENSVTDFATLVGDPSGTYTISDVDAYQERLYVTVNNSGDITKPTFFIFDISDPSDPSLEGSVDNEGAGGVTAVGLNAVRVSKDPASDKTYAFTANAFSTNYGALVPPGCDPATTKRCGQLVIFDVTDDPSSPALTNAKLASSPPINGSTYGTSIFYKNGYILLGLAAADGPEFHIIDVHKPADFFASASHLIPSVGNFEIGNGINALNLRGTYAYLATPNAEELKILNITNPNTPTLAGNFADGSGNGKSMYLVGDKLYLGKTTGAADDFFILDNTDPSATLPKLGGIDFGSSVNAVVVRDYLAFILTNNKLQIYNISNPSSPTLVDDSISVFSNTTEPSMDCEGNRLYISSNNSSGKGALYVVKSGN